MGDSPVEDVALEIALAVLAIVDDIERIDGTQVALNLEFRLVSIPGR